MQRLPQQAAVADAADVEVVAQGRQVAPLRVHQRPEQLRKAADRAAVVDAAARAEAFQLAMVRRASTAWFGISDTLLHQFPARKQPDPVAEAAEDLAASAEAAVTLSSPEITP